MMLSRHLRCLVPLVLFLLPHTLLAQQAEAEAEVVVSSITVITQQRR